MAIDVSRAAQLRDIDTSFSAIESSDLSALRHPTRPELVAVDAFEVLPDADIWANAYDLFRFSERPGDRAVDVSLPSLSFPPGPPRPRAVCRSRDGCVAEC